MVMGQALRVRGDRRIGRTIWWQDTEGSAAFPASMITWRDGAPLAAIDQAALIANPGVAGELFHLMLPGVIDRNAAAVFIHALHHGDKRRSMIREDVKPFRLPLVNHLMGERATQLAFRHLRPTGQACEKRGR